MTTQTEVKTATRKIAVNKCYGGFGLSDAAFIELMRRKGQAIYAVPQSLGSDYWRTPVDKLPPILLKPRYEAAKGGQEEEYRKASEAAGRVYQHDYLEKRDDPDLIAVIEEMGSAASDALAAIEITEIPADVAWEIEECDGREWISEAHRTW